MAKLRPHGSGTTECADNSDWMSKLSEKLTLISLWNLALPGRPESGRQDRLHIVTQHAIMWIEATAMDNMPAAQ